MYPEPKEFPYWLFDRIHLDPRIQIKNVDTNLQANWLKYPDLVLFCPFLQWSQMVLSQCPWHRKGRCLFRHWDGDAGMTPPMTRTEEEIGTELAAIWAAVSKTSLMWRTGHEIDVPVPQVTEEPAMKQEDSRGDGGDAGDHCRWGRGRRHLTA